MNNLTIENLDTTKCINCREKKTHYKFCQKSNFEGLVKIQFKNKCCKCERLETKIQEAKNNLITLEWQQFQRNRMILAFN
jgi:hypothetical protein